jgi:hypothetical protein
MRSCSVAPEWPISPPRLRTSSAYPWLMASPPP